MRDEQTMTDVVVIVVGRLDAANGVIFLLHLLDTAPEQAQQKNISQERTEWIQQCHL